MRAALTLLAAALLAGSAHAADPWGLEHESEATFTATVVDVLCELTGDCPANCGDGKRQLGLLRDDGTLVAVAKGQVLFANAIPSLLPFCGRTVEVDGLLYDDPAMRIYFAQYVREPGSEEWQPTDAFQERWTARHGEAPEWFRADPLVQEVIEEKGVLGDPSLSLE